MEDISPTSKKQEKRRDNAPVTPPVTKKQIPMRTRTTLTGSSPPVKNIKAFVVHGVPCRRQVNDTIQDLRRAGMKGIRGARWLIGETPRMNKTTGSVVVFLKEEISFVVSKEGLSMRLRGRNLPVDRYDFDWGWKKKDTEEGGSWAKYFG